MPDYSVIIRRDGQVELLSGDAAEDALESIGEKDTHLGDFRAENEQEAWRQLATVNPAIDMQQRRLLITADADAALAEEKAKFLEGVREETVGNLVLPDDTGAEEDEVVEEEVEEDDPENPGQKKKTVRKTKKSKTTKKPASKSKK